MNHCLVTGATGFIGRVLCEELHRRGVRLRATARHEEEGPWNEFVVADLAEPAPPADLLEGVDTVFHLAGKAHALSEMAGEDSEYDRINVGGTRALLELARTAGVARFIFFSSVKAMNDDGDACVDEAYPPAPVTPYGVSKLESERLVLAAGNANDMHVCVLRLTLVYGRGAKGNLWKMMEAIDRGRFPPLPAVGNKRSMVHVDDVVRAALLVAEAPEARGKTYILTDGQPSSTDELCAMMRDALGRRAPAWSLPLVALRGLGLVGDVVGRVRGRRFMFDSDACEKLLGSSWYSARKIEEELGFRPSRTLREGVGEMVARFRQAQRGDSGVNKVAVPPAS